MIPNVNYEDAFKGVFTALLAAFVLVFGISVIKAIDANPLSDTWEWIIVNPWWLLYKSSLFVIPVGAIVGIVIPLIVRDRKPADAALLGLVIGLLVGATQAAVQITFIIYTGITNSDNFSAGDLIYLVKVAFVSLVFIGIYSSAWTVPLTYYRARSDWAQ